MYSVQESYNLLTGLTNFWGKEKNIKSPDTVLPALRWIDQSFSIPFGVLTVAVITQTNSVIFMYALDDFGKITFPLIIRNHHKDIFQYFASEKQENN